MDNSTEFGDMRIHIHSLVTGNMEDVVDFFLLFTDNGLV